MLGLPQRLSLMESRRRPGVDVTAATPGLPFQPSPSEADTVSETPDEQTQEQDGPEPDEATPLQPVEPEPDEDEDDGSEDVEGVPGTEPEPDETQEPPEDAHESQALSQSEIEKRLDKLNREAKRHGERVVAIMDDAMGDLTPCELCWPFAPGFRWAMIPDEQRANVMLTIGVSEVANYMPDTHSQECPDCRGWGVVATGSKVQGQDALPCKGCNGQGWVGDRAAVSALTPTPIPVADVENGAPQQVPPSPEVEEAIRVAKAAGLTVVDTRVPATS